MTRFDANLGRVERVCVRDDLRTYDPYDIWKTALGYRIKDLFNCHRWAGLIPAAALTVFDTYLNNGSRWFYQSQEYPIVRAWAALCLINLQDRPGIGDVLPAVRRHLDWLRRHVSQGYIGSGWGLGFRQPISVGLHYEADLPLSTMTPYPLEAFVRYSERTGDTTYEDVIRGVYDFLERDLVVMERTSEYEITSYGAVRDRRVVNAVSYVMFCLAMLLPWLSTNQTAAARSRIGRLYRYLELVQRSDGSWYYSPDGPPFIDCFHTCIVLKNLVRTARILELPGADGVTRRGYDYLLGSFFNESTGLFRRFALTNKPSLVHYDLYDNAEAIHCAGLMGDHALANRVVDAVEKSFVRGDDVYSQIDRFGLLHNRNTLRWAVMPYFYSLTAMER